MSFGQAVLQKLDFAADELAALVLHDLETALPFWRTMTGGIAEDAVRQGVRRVATTYVDAVKEGRQLTGDEIAHVEALGTVLAASGLDEHEILECVDVGTRRSWEYLIEAAEAMSSQPGSVRGIASVLIHSNLFIDDVRRALTRGVARHDPNAPGVGTARTKQALVDEVVSGTFTSDEGVVARALAFGHDLSVPHGLFVVAPPARNAPNAALVARAAATCAHDVTGALHGSAHETPIVHVPVLVPAPERWEWAKRLVVADRISHAHGVVVAAIEPVLGPASISAAYQEVVTLLPAGIAVCHPGVVTPREMARNALFCAAPEQDRHVLVRRALGPLLDLPDGERTVLFRSVDAFLASNSVQAAANRVRLNEKTVHRHLVRIHKLTGLDPMVRSDLVELGLALFALRSLSHGPSVVD